MRHLASFRPQAKRRDGNIYCVPPEGETEWDATEWVANLSEDERDEAFKPDTFSSDRLSADPNAPEWIREWSGPFYITLEEVTDAEMAEFQQFRLGVASDGQECPLCHSGTVEVVRVGDIRSPCDPAFSCAPGDFDSETRCRGECGAVAPTAHPLISGHPLAAVAAKTLGGEEFSVADMLTVRNLVRVFEEHLSQESHRLGVAVETLCPCSGDEVNAARELLARLDPLLTV